MEARADSKQECAAAYEKTQTLRDQGKLLDARKQALACSASTCSVYVVKDCAQWLSDIEASMPTVLVTAEDAAGFDTVAVSVTVDGQLVAKTLAKALSIDPGEHVLRFETDGTEAIEQKVSLRPGEKNRKLAISFKKPSPAGSPLIVPPAPTAPLPSAAPRSATQPPAEPVAAPGPERVGRRVPGWAWVSGGAGVVAAGVGVGFGVGGLNANSAVIARCGGNAAKCPRVRSTYRSNGWARKVRGRWAGSPGRVSLAAVISESRAAMAVRSPPLAAQSRATVIPVA